MGDDSDLFGPPEGPAPSQPTQPGPPTEPIRPKPPGSEPIPERIRQPITVPHQVSTIGGLPRPVAIAAIVGAVIVFLVGILVGRATKGDEEAAVPPASGVRKAACVRAVNVTLQVVELQRQAIVNRTEATQALALGDDGRVAELNTELESLAPAIQEAEAAATAAAEKCRSGGGGGGKGKGQGKGNKNEDQPAGNG